MFLKLLRMEASSLAKCRLLLQNFSNNQAHKLTINCNYHHYNKGKIVGRKEKFMNENDILFGRNVCKIALKYSKRPIFRILLNKNWLKEQPDDKRIEMIIELAKERKIPFSYIPSYQLTELSQNRPHQGVCIEAGRLSALPINNFILNELIEKNCEKLWILLNDVYDTHNMGAIIRTCSFLGIKSIFVTSNCASISGSVCKASSGSSELLDFYQVVSSTEFLQLLKKNDWEIMGTDLPPPNDCLNFNKYQDIVNTTLHKKTLLILGNEASGICDQLKPLCDRLLTIKRKKYSDERSFVSCLNVSAATAIILHRLLQ